MFMLMLMIVLMIMSVFMFMHMLMLMHHLLKFVSIDINIFSSNLAFRPIKYFFRAEPLI